LLPQTTLWHRAPSGRTVLCHPVANGSFHGLLLIGFFTPLSTLFNHYNNSGANQPDRPQRDQAKARPTVNDQPLLNDFFSRSQTDLCLEVNLYGCFLKSWTSKVLNAIWSFRYLSRPSRLSISS
jgi:hypothetical protein